MPARKTLVRRATGDLGKLREIIASGKPWTQKSGELGGYFDVYGLVSDHFTILLCITAARLTKRASAHYG